MLTQFSFPAMLMVLTLFVRAASEEYQIMGEAIAIAPEAMFGWAGQAAMIGWFILIFLPRRWPQLLFIPRYLIPFGLSLLYAGLAFAHFFTIEGGGYNSLDQVRILLSKEEMLLAGWVHYLAFDLFIGGWIAVEADKVGLNRLFQAPILVATFMFGPVGLALFLAMRAGHFRKQEAGE